MVVFSAGVMDRGGGAPVPAPLARMTHDVSMTERTPLILFLVLDCRFGRRDGPGRGGRGGGVPAPGLRARRALLRHRHGAGALHAVSARENF